MDSALTHFSPESSEAQELTFFFSWLKEVVVKKNLKYKLQPIRGRVFKYLNTTANEKALNIKYLNSAILFQLRNR